VETQTIKEIAKNPDVRLDAWILKKWNVLPSNPDFQNLTEEQRKWLWEDYLLDNPELAKKLRHNEDDEFDKEWDEMEMKEGEPEESPEDSDESGYSEYESVGDKFNRFVNDNGMEVERSQEAQAILTQLKQRDNNDEDDMSIGSNLNDDDWEEVDD
jgi:hypothetical protein